HLNISSCCGIEGSCRGGFPTLTHLIATRCNLNDAGLGTISTRSHLQYLDVSFCDYIGCPLHEILTLTHLNLEHCGRVTDESLKNISELRELQHLQLRDCMSITDDGLWNLSALSQLQYLDLSYNKQVTDAGIGSMSLDHLQHLNLFLCSISGDCFSTFPRVTSLDLGACRVTDSCLVSLLRLPHLQRVCLDHYNNIDLSIIAAQFQLKERAHTRGWWERL
ncbi:receptor-type protein kinase, putative, partial [Bodo saltans]